MKPLSNEFPRSDNVLFVFYDFETTQNTKISDLATVHVPNLVCIRQFCSLCEMQPYIDVDCGKRKHAFFDDPVGDPSCLCKPRQWCEKVVAVAHNEKSFDAQFILNRAIFLKWKPELIFNGIKIMCMKMHHLTFIDSVSFLPMPLRKLPEAF
jgi:DNA polymerase III alpha subunit (gram-positive type)